MNRWQRIPQRMLDWWQGLGWSPHCFWCQKSHIPEAEFDNQTHRFHVSSPSTLFWISETITVILWMLSINWTQLIEITSALTYSSSLNPQKERYKSLVSMIRWLSGKSRPLPINSEISLICPSWTKDASGLVTGHNEQVSVCWKEVVKMLCCW